GHGPVGDLGRTLRDVDHVRDPPLAVAAGTQWVARPAPRAPRAQALGQVTTQFAAPLDEQRLVDRLGRHLHLQIIWVVHPQPVRDLVRGVLLLQPILHLLSQPGVAGQPGLLGPTSQAIGTRLSRPRPIPALAGVAAQLATDRARITLQSRSDRRPGASY